jgi:hypothetical protein
VRQLGKHLPRAALWVVVLLLLAGSLATVGMAQAASSPNYTLTGYAFLTTSGTFPAGVQVDLVSRATGATFTTNTLRGGSFNFTTASTGGALVPGYWGVSIPAAANLTLSAYRQPAAAVPLNQTTQFFFLNTTALSTTNYPVLLDNITVLNYNGKIAGTVTSGGSPEEGAQVQLLWPAYNGLVLYSNTTNASGGFTLKAPPSTPPSPASWVVETTAPSAAVAYNLSKVVVSSGGTTTLNPTINTYLVSGRMYAHPGSPVPTAGNVTLFDTNNGYIYSNPTPVGGSYSAGTYPAGFSGSGSQTFSVILSSIGYSTTSFPLTFTTPPPAGGIVRDATMAALLPSQRGIYSTTLNFAGIDVYSGKGNLTVTTNAVLGNDTVFANLPNASVGQMWAQLGLAFAHSTTLPFADLSDLYAWENASGPFFPAVQAGTAINGTGFLGQTVPQSLQSLSSTCTSSSTCGLGFNGNIHLGWNETYALNGTLATTNSSAYTLSFGFAHPTSYDTYNYTVILPTGYVLAAGAPAPSHTQLVPAGPGKTWTKFTLVSQPSPTPSGTASFSIVKYANLTANVNVSAKNFAFSTQNVLNATHGNYTVVIGVGQNATFSALNSTYPAGTNGTLFQWTFGTTGPGNTTTTGQPTTNYTYATASGATPYAGTLKVTSSGGLVNSTDFYVWVGEGPVTAAISTNASSSANRTANGHPYLFVNWGTVLYLNATASTAKISPTAPIPGNISVAYFSITAKGYKASTNFSASQGAVFTSPYTFQFLGAGVYYANHTSINGTVVNFKGWQYNITLRVWDSTGQSASTILVVLVNDTEKPVASFQILNSAGKGVSGSGVIASTSNLTAKVQLNGANASDPHNGSLTKYYWLITNSGNSTIHLGTNVTTVKPYPTYWLAPQAKPYTVNLTVWDLNGNRGYTTQSLAVSPNSTTTPIMAANNLTAPTTLTSGSSQTIWVNITTGGGSQAVAKNVTVSFYLTSPSGTSRSYIAGSPGTVKFFNYTGGVVSATPFATGVIASMSYNTTYRAEITWSPVGTGNFVLYANVTAQNEYSGSYINGPQVTSQSITVNPNPTTQLLEYVAIGAAVVVVILLIVLYYRRRTGRTTGGKSTGRSGLERGRSRSGDDEDEDDES